MLLSDIKANQTYEMIRVDLWTKNVGETEWLEPDLMQNINDDEAYEELLIMRDWVHFNIFYRSIIKERLKFTNY